MPSSMQPIKVYGASGPNPPKVAMLAEELGLTYETIDVPFTDVKKPEYTAINPNGRIPAIYDPNTDLTLWESGAILEYLVEKYDKERKVSFETGTKEYYLAKQWLFFQVSGQGPYYGNAVYFKKYQPNEEAYQRFEKEVHRVSGVLESHLEKQKAEYPNSGGVWLVGGKFSYADLAWMMWQFLIGKLVAYEAKEFPLVSDWLSKMGDREAIAKVVDRAMKAHG